MFLQQLALLRGFDIGAMDPLGADFVHTVVECAKLAYADREAYYGDPDFADVPLGDAAVRRIQRRTAQAGRRHARRWSCGPGTVPGCTPWVDHEAAPRARIC